MWNDLLLLLINVFTLKFVAGHNEEISTLALQNDLQVVTAHSAVVIALHLIITKIAFSRVLQD